MCGFVGFTGNIANQEEVLDKMLERIIHRGPDQTDKFINYSVALGFRRLSIVDVSASSQPIFNENRTLALLFNGEIYNHNELREELKEQGHIFETMTDSEVLVHLYEEHGTGMVNKLRGMFAFVIYDIAHRTLFMVRDHFGIKPLYYYKTKNNNILFGSEIKSFLDHPEFEKKLNKELIHPYLCFQYSSILDDTLFEGVKKLPAGHCMLVDSEGNIEIEQYYDVKFGNSSFKKELETYIEETRKVVNESVKVHSHSEVPLGSFLSGGIDSSYITSELKPSKTFSVGFHSEQFNESNLAKELSDILEIENVSKIISSDECFDNLRNIVYHLDEPQSNPSTVPLYFLAKLAREHVTIVLSGEGADEIFAGYDWYADDSRMSGYRKLPACLRNAIASVAEKLPDFKGRTTLIRNGSKVENYFIGQAQIFEDREANSILNQGYKSSLTTKDITSKVYSKVSDKDNLTKKQYLDLKLWLAGDILLKADKMSMAHSLELRVPFLDKEVMDFARTIPSEYRMYNGISKYVLRKASENVLPSDWSNRQKKGFPVPIRLWLKEERYYKHVRSYFNSEYAKEIFNQKELLTLLDDHYSGKTNNARKVWTIFIFLVWYERFFIIEN